MMRLLITILLCFPLCAVAQQKKLQGIVRDALTMQPVAGVTVFLNNAQTLTDSLGRYMLDLRNCGTCRPGSIIRVLTQSDAYGSHEMKVTIPGDWQHDIIIPRQPGYITVSGAVTTEDGNQPLPGIIIYADTDNLTEQQAVCDSSGFFSLRLHKKYLPDFPFVRIRAVDGQRRYQQVQTGWEICKTTNFCRIVMLLQPYDKIRVSDLRHTGIPVHKGDEITIRATGFVHTGIGRRDNNPLGLPDSLRTDAMTNYYVNARFGFGALLYRTSNQKKWRLAGSRQHFTVETDGYLLLCINDKDCNDNQGYFEVEVIVRRYSDMR